jgi:hypothetical protein
MALGRISGPLLKSNLLRNGVNLAFENDLLYFDVTNRRIGINTGTPSHDLQVNGTTRTTTLNVSGTSTLGQIQFTGNSITSTDNQINFIAGGTNPVVYQGVLQVGQLQLTNNSFSTLTSNTDITFTTTGTGAVVMNSNLTVTGNVYTQGNLTVDGTVTIKGNITIGDQTTDTVAINAEINSNLIPDITTSTLVGATISGTIPGVLTFSSSTGAAVRAGMWLSGGSVTAGTFIVSGSGTTWTLNQAATGTPTTATGSYNLGSPSATWNNIYANQSFFENINVTNFQTANLSFTNNTISNIVNNANINFNTLGVGGIVIGNIKVNANSLLNVVPNAVTTFNQTTADATFTGSISDVVLTVSGSLVNTIKTGMVISGSGITQETYIVNQLSGTTGGLGTYTVSQAQEVTSTAITATVTGYVYIGGTNGVVIPAGTTAQRAGNPIAGMIRFNTDPTSRAVEVYTGTQWASVAGVTSGITQNQATDTAVQWALTLG